MKKLIIIILIPLLVSCATIQPKPNLHVNHEDISNVLDIIIIGADIIWLHEMGVF